MTASSRPAAPLLLVGVAGTLRMSSMWRVLATGAVFAVLAAIVAEVGRVGYRLAIHALGVCGA